MDKCETCKYFVADKGVVDGDKPIDGRCHRYPPVLFHGASGLGFVPQMRNHDGCGEHKPKITGPEPAPNGPEDEPTEHIQADKDCGNCHYNVEPRPLGCDTCDDYELWRPQIEVTNETPPNNQPKGTQ